MALPVSKSALDRLGVRLAAGDSISDGDLAQLAQVVDAYQDVLNEVKLRLTELGYSSTTRMKTTGTLVDKLRRETARLSQVQDLAGARIVVPKRVDQDRAVSEISSAFEAAGSTCRISDRRERDSHGYRAVHVVVQADKVPVEIQVRTELQDSWAQLVERFADIWGRGIRYGEEPDLPDAHVGDGEPIVSRREAVSMLMQLSGMTAKTEERLESQRRWSEFLEHLAGVARGLAGLDFVSSTIGDSVDEHGLDMLEQWIASLTSLASDEAAPLFVEWRHMTLARFGEALQHAQEIASRYLERNGDELRSIEHDLRGMLGRFAAAMGEG